MSSENNGPRSGGIADRAFVMIPVNTTGLPTARRIQIGLLCPHCGQQSPEFLASLNGRYAKACRRCRSRISLTDENNRVLVEELVKFCMNIDLAPKG
jgi:hypothetical protein